MENISREKARNPWKRDAGVGKQLNTQQPAAVNQL